MIRIIVIWLAGSLLLTSGASAQQPGPRHGDTTRTMHGRPMTGEMTMSMMDSADARLDRLASIMNQTTGSRKVQAMAAVINEMMAQRKMMRRHARQMMTTPNAMMGPGTGGGRSMMQNMRPVSPDPAHAPAGPDTTGQQHQP